MSTNYEKEAGGRSMFDQNVTEGFVSSIKHPGFTPLAAPRRSQKLKEDYTGATAPPPAAAGKTSPASTADDLKKAVESLISAVMSFDTNDADAMVLLSKILRIRRSIAEQKRKTGGVAESYRDILRSIGLDLTEPRPVDRGSLAEVLAG